MVTALCVFFCLACMHTGITALEQACEHTKPVPALVQLVWSLMFLWAFIFAIALIIAVNSSSPTFPKAFPW